MCFPMYRGFSDNNTTHKPSESINSTLGLYHLYTRIIYKQRELLIYKSLHTGVVMAWIRGLFPPISFPPKAYNKLCLIISDILDTKKPPS